MRGWSGKPLRPPLTDIPIGAYKLAAVVDVVSLAGRNHGFAREFYRAGTFVIVGGAVVSLLAAITGFWDWLRSTEAGTQARHTANAHAWTMLDVTALVLVDIALRTLAYTDDGHTPVAVLGLSVAVATLTTLGSAIDGTLTFDYGFNVEAAGDGPVWHPSEDDLLPGEHPPAGTRAAPQQPPGP